MERGVYFDGWYKHNHCYHPSLPVRTLQMLEDLELYHGTALVWAGMGGGSISLPYLEQEAFGPLDPRMRFYGGMTDSEFAAECGKRGIKLFGIVFEVQGWEFPAVFDDEGHIVKLNLHAEGEPHEWYGLREFSQDKYPNAFRTSLKDYYPEGIYNSLGEKVEDIREECAIRDMHGTAIHAQWVEVKGHKAQAYQMCRNNPVWRNYLKKIMELQIDAGVQGIQLDECELPMSSIWTGGCFCKDCMREFTEYLTEKRNKGELGSQWDGIDVEHFNYRDYLLGLNCKYPDDAPFFKDFWEYQVCQVRKYFGELADHARAYGQEKYGRKILISGNFYNLQPAYHPIVPKADIIITEMEHSLYRQPHFYRYSAGFAEGKSVIIAENPYGGIIPELVPLLDRGKAYDLYRVFMMEPSVYGCNMSVPYGSWMGNTIKDAFWPPREVTAQIQQFLYDHEDFFPAGPVKGAAVLYAYKSNYWRDAHRSGDANEDANASNRAKIDVMATDWGNSDHPMPFWDVIRYMSAKNALYDVKMMPDGTLREDDFTAEALKPYPMIVLPDCYALTDNQLQIIRDYAAAGGLVLVYGRLAEDAKGVQAELAKELAAMDNVTFVPLGMEEFAAGFDRMYGQVSTLICTDPRVGAHRFDSGTGTYIHLLNYDYREEKDCVMPIDSLEIMVKDVEAGAVKVYTLAGETDDFSCVKEEDGVRIILRNVPAYMAVEILSSFE